MSSIFYRLHTLLRSGQSSKHEDFFTELFAEILRESDTALGFFNEVIGYKLNEIKGLKVYTQKKYIKLPHHKSGSIVDIVIEFLSNEEHHILFFENKIDGIEGPEQLRRYADHLKNYLNNDKRVALIFTTKNYESKEEVSKDFKDEGVPFFMLRWYRVYQWLKQKDKDLIDHVLKYMEALKMDQSRKFAPIDIIVMQEMKRIVSMMDECFDDQVKEVFNLLYGQQAKAATRLTQLRDYNFYNSYSQLNSKPLYVGCGFLMSDDEYPLATVYYEIDPSYPGKDNELARINKFASSHGGWVKEGYDDERVWPGIYFKKSLVDFLQQGDHILAIQEYFIEKLKELKGLVKGI